MRTIDGVPKSHRTRANRASDRSSESDPRRPRRETQTTETRDARGGRATLLGDVAEARERLVLREATTNRRLPRTDIFERFFFFFFFFFLLLERERDLLLPSVVRRHPRVSKYAPGS